MSFYTPDSIIYQTGTTQYKDYKPDGYNVSMQLAEKYFKECQVIFSDVYGGDVGAFYQFIRSYKEHLDVQNYLHSLGDTTYSVIETKSKHGSIVKIYTSDKIVKLEIETIFYHIIVTDDAMEYADNLYYWHRYKKTRRPVKNLPLAY